MTDQADLWLQDAACRGMPTEMFYPEPGLNNAPRKMVKDVCRGCSVRVECLVASLNQGELLGTWGGLNQTERRALRLSVLAGELNILDIHIVDDVYMVGGLTTVDTTTSKGSINDIENRWETCREEVCCGGETCG